MIKKIFIFLGILLAVLAIIFGSYLPFEKSRSYVRAINMLNSIKTLPEFEDVFGRALSFYSPIGQEEIVKFFQRRYHNKPGFAE